MAERIRFDDLDGEVEEAPGLVSSFVAGAAQGGTFNLGDEMEGAQQGTAAALLGAGSAALRGDWEGVTQAPKLGLETYRAVRDGRRAENRVREAANPTSYGSGQFAGAVGSGVATGGLGAGLRGAIAVGAGEGALSGLGGNDDDLTFQDAEAYARAFRDTLEGGGAGAAGGGIGYGVGKGLQWVGGKARNALGRARGELAEEIRAGLDAEADALRAGDAREAALLERAQGQGLEMNKRVDARAAREEARRVAKEARDAARAERAARGPARRTTPVDPNAEPDTKVLGGFQGKAGERRAVNFDRVEAYRRNLADPNWKGDRARAQRYVDDYADAVDNAGAFERRMVERYLRERYSPEVAERILRERVGPNGEILPRRPAAPATEAPETTQIQDAGDWARRGQYERAGGGGSAFGDEFANAPTRVDARMQPDPFHDAPTRAGLVRTAEPRVVDGHSTSPLHEFNFRDPKSGRDYLVVAREAPHDDEGLILEIVRPLDIDTEKAISPEGWAAERGRVGPGTIKQLSQELARAFPGRRVLHAERATGANPREQMSMRLPEVTSPGNSPPYEVTRTEPMGLRDAVIQGRGEEFMAMGGGGPSAFGDMFAEAPTRVDRPRPAVTSEPSMRAPQDVPLPPAEAATRATVVPQVRRGPMRQPMAEVQPQPAATQVGQPAVFTDRTRYAPPGMDQRLAGRPSVDDLVAERERGALPSVLRAGYEGARQANNSLAAPVGALVGLTREALRNPAVRARAITLFKLDRLARVNPAAWGRVSATLTRAAQQDEAEGTDVHLKAARHVLLQRDAEFRAADAAVAEELQNLDEDALARRLSQP